jgi:glycosyltransferase involved in cell wall biosynthesis
MRSAYGIENRWTESKQIVHYLPKFSLAHWGGAEQTIVHMVKELERDGFHSRVWSNLVFSKLGHEMIGGVDVRRFGSFFQTRNEASTAGLGKASLSLSLLGRLLVERQIDLLHVHTHNRMASTLVALSHARRLPVVLSLHSQFVDLRPRWRYQFVNEFAIRHASHVTTPNNGVRDSILALGIPPSNVTVVPNGVAQDVFARGSKNRFRSRLGLQDEPIILTVGRICEVKNQRVVLDVLPLIHERYAGVHWVLIGVPSEPDYFDHLRRETARRGLGATVHFVPGLPPESEELADAYAAADVAVIPSLHEGFPLVLLEAWASGTPVVATGVGGLREAIQSGTNGLLVEPRDPLGLAEGIVQVMEQGTLRQRLIREAQKQLTEFAWSTIAERLAAVYRRVLA